MSLSIAMVALGPKAKLSPAAIQADLARKWPRLPKAQAAEEKEGTFAFRIGEANVIVGLMPAPIPWGDLEEPCATSWLWPDAAKVLKQHTQHLIVTVMGDEDPIARARLLTQVIASILATCPEAVGVYWGDAGLVIPPGLFQDFTKEILPGAAPLYLWVHFRLGKLGGGKSGGFTRGLKAFGHMEFETEDSPEKPSELRDRFYGLANYVLDNGPVIKDGDTVGEDANERIRVVYAKSAFGQEGKVMRLEYSAAKAKKPWWRPW